LEDPVKWITLPLFLIAIAVVAVIATPTKTTAQSIVGLTCAGYDTTTSREAYGSVRWTWKVCTDYLSVQSGLPPFHLGDFGLCDEQIYIPEPALRVLTCNWAREITVADARRSYSGLFCEVVEERYGFQNDAGAGGLIVACTDRRAYLRALTGSGF